jgi:CrcB protein
MRELLLVGSGGFVGSVARYLLSGLVTQMTTASRFPFGTLAVNSLGCLIIGALSGMAEHSGAFSANTRLLLFTGVLGGFTTFSAFAFETWFLGREQAWPLAVVNIVAQVVLGIGAVFLGYGGVRLATR